MELPFCRGGTRIELGPDREVSAAGHAPGARWRSQARDAKHAQCNCSQPTSVPHAYELLLAILPCPNSIGRFSPASPPFDVVAKPRGPRKTPTHPLTPTEAPHFATSPQAHRSLRSRQRHIVYDDEYEDVGNLDAVEENPYAGIQLESMVFVVRATHPCLLEARLPCTINVRRRPTELPSTQRSLHFDIPHWPDLANEAGALSRKEQMAIARAKTLVVNLLGLIARVMDVPRRSSLRGFCQIRDSRI
ncbi:hypothetical protein FB567DRAFT_9722 [Paraphoma chrysanthemicola]|uniref:Uncharacterized protein n=1 Tax=Paraphoma chrysanthemicola TaxID=798071 RepID=A0A8K0RJU1_9PLEO|nr:hypothetical protein FB567DRAFT_9722 [Paraphoma chrysanthemicola]